MESLETKLDNIKTLTEFNDLINSEKTFSTGRSFMGARIVQVEDSNDSVPLIKLWNTFTKHTKTDAPLTLKDRVIAMGVADKIREIEGQDESIKMPDGLFGTIYKIGVFIRKLLISDPCYDCYGTPDNNNYLLKFTHESYEQVTGQKPITIEYDENLDPKSHINIENKTVYMTETALRQFAAEQ